MNLKIRKELLEKIITKVSCGLGEKSEDPITKNLGIEVVDDKLRIVSSSQKISAEYVLNKNDDFEVTETGKVVVDGQGFIGNISNLHSGVLLNIFTEVIKEGENDQKRLVISYMTKDEEECVNNHNLIDETYFPAVDFNWATKHSLKYPADQFIENISKTSCAASDENFRPDYNAVLINFAKDGVVFFASDGRQMAYIKDSNNVFADEKIALIQSQVINKISKKRILDTDSDLEISIKESKAKEKNTSKVRIKQDGFTILSNFADANRLPYEKILAIGGEHCSFSINAGKLRDSLKPFSDLENKDTKWKFAKEKIAVTNVKGFSRKTKGTITGVTSYIGNECEVDYSLKYWDGMLSKCDSLTDLKVVIHNPRMPIDIEITPAPNLYKFFIMPINEAE